MSRQVDRYGFDEEGQLATASYRAVNPEGTASQAKRSDIFHCDALGNREGSNYLASRGGTLNFLRRNKGRADGVASKHFDI